MEKTEKTLQEKQELIERYEYLRQRKTDLDDELKSVKAEFAETEEKLADLMIEIDEPVTSFGAYQYSLKIKTRYSFKNADELAEAGIANKFKALKDAGYGDLVYETVNANSLNSTMGEVAEANGGKLPEELSGFIKGFDQNGISRTKLRTKAAKSLVERKENWK